MTKLKIKNPLSKKVGFIVIMLLFLVGPNSSYAHTQTAFNINKNKSLETDIITQDYEENKQKNRIVTSSTALVQKHAAIYGLDWKLVEAIIIHETGNRTSSAFKTRHNSCGMMRAGRIIKFDNEESGIISCISNLKNNYFDQGLQTPEQMQRKYAPVSKSWTKKIHYFYDRL